MQDQAAYTVGTPFAPKNILAGGTYTTRKITVAEGEVRDVGAVMGQAFDADDATVTPGAAVSGSGGTVGNGSIGTVTCDDGAPAGVWHVRITAEATDAGTFVVERPDGSIDGYGEVAVAYNGGLNFTLADGSNNWQIGDYIPVTVSYDASTYKLSVAAATDGSQVPDVVLMQPVDATDGPVEAMAYETAQVVGSALTLGAGHTIDSIREGLRQKGITIS